MSVFDYIENNYEIDFIQRVLLVSLVSEGPKNINFFKKWISSVDFNSLDYASFRLIPALFIFFKISRKKIHTTVE